MWAHDTADDYIDLLSRLDDFLTDQGSAFGLTYAGTGDGRFTAYTGGPQSIAETITITATSATSFDVDGSVTGAIGTATVDTPFTSDYINFTIVDGATPFVSGDEFVISTAAPYTNARRHFGARLTASNGNTGQYAVQNLIDGKTAADSARLWNPGTISTSEWVEFQFDTAKTVVEITVLIGSWSVTTTGVKLEGWNGSSWDTLLDATGLAWSNGERKVLSVTSPGAYDLYRMTFSGSNGGRTIDAVEMREAVGTHDMAGGGVIWVSTGNDGNSALYMGVRTLYRDDVDYYDWEVVHADGFNNNLNLNQQPGYHGQRYLPLWDDPIPYWFIATGRSVIVIAKMSFQYEVAILGLGDPFFTPEQLPLPAVLGAPIALGPVFGGALLWNDTGFRYSNSGNSHNSPTHSDPGVSATNVHNHQLSVRKHDGTWVGLEAKRNDSQSTAPQPTHSIIWPYRGNLNLLDPHEDGSYSIDPIVLITADPNVMCKLPGIYCITGQGMSAETLKRYGAVDLLVLPNVFRVDREDWLAVRLD